MGLPRDGVADPRHALGAGMLGSLELSGTGFIYLLSNKSEKVMSKWIILLICLAVASCGGDGSSDDPNNHGFGWSFDVQGATGLKVRYDPEELKQGVPQTPVHIFENQYNEVQKCAALYAPPPFVIFVPDESLPDNAGFYYSDPPLITIKGLFIFKHEVVHYLLDYNTGDLDPSHASPLWGHC